MDDPTALHSFQPTEQYSTSEAPGDKRTGKWRDHLAKVYFGLDVQAPAGGVLEGGLLKRALRQTKVSELRGSTQRMVRTAELAKNDRIESFVLISPVNGRFEYADRSRCGIALRGQTFALASADHHEVAISGGARMVCLELPATMMEERGLKADGLRAEGCFSDPLLSGLLRGFGRNVLYNNTSTGVETIEKIFLDVVEVAFGARRGDPIGISPPQVLDDAIFQRFLEVVSRNFHDHSFGLAKCAAACGVSKRRLQTLLQARGTSFTGELLGTRLDEAKRLIVLSREAPLAIGRAAEMCGFSSQGYFATCYRRRHGISPRDDRLR